MSQPVEIFEDDFLFGSIQPTQTQGTANSRFFASQTATCLNCGGSKFFLEESTMKNVCENCFTEAHGARDQIELGEFGENQGLWDANRVKYAETGNRNKGYDPNDPYCWMPNHKSRLTLAQRLERLQKCNKAVPFPDLVACLKGFQRVLIVCVQNYLSKLLQLSEQETNEVLKTVHSLWKAYLKAWSDGAQHYGSLYPEVSFSMHQSLLESIQISNVTNVATYDVLKKHKLQLNKNEGNGTAKGKDGDDKVEAGKDGKQNSSKAPQTQENKIKSADISRTKTNIESSEERLDENSGSEQDDDDDEIEDIFQLIKSDVVDDDDNNNVDDDDNNNVDDDDNNNADGGDDNNVEDDKGDDNDVKHDNDTDYQEGIKEDEYDVKDGTGRPRSKQSLSRKLKLKGIRLILVNQHAESATQKYMDAALALDPSMQLAAALILLATYPSFGVTSIQLCQWISANALPLMNAFDFLLTPEQQRTLSPADRLFRMRQPLSPTDLEREADILSAACRLKSRYTEKLVVRNNLEKRQSGSVRFVQPDCVPKITAQLVADLGLGQDVLDRALGWMGFTAQTPKEKDEESSQQQIKGQEDSDDGSASERIDVPKKAIKQEVAGKKKSGSGKYFAKPWPRADPSQLLDATQILAVLLLSCFVDPNFRNWSFAKGPIGGESSQQVCDLVGDQITSTDGRKINKKMGRREIHLKYAPKSREELHLLGNGKHFENYVNFLEKVVVDDEENEITQFARLLRKEDLTVQGEMENSSQTTTPVKKEEYEMGDHSTVPTSREEQTVLCDVRPYPYVVAGRSTTFDSHRQERRKRKRTYNFETFPNLMHYADTKCRSLREVDPQQRMLIVYTAHVTRTDASRLEDCIRFLLRQE